MNLPPPMPETVSPPSAPATSRLHAAFSQLRDALSAEIVGQAALVERLLIALLADGVPMDKLYPLDVDRAFRKLEQIKPDIATWWTSGGQSAQLISDGEVDMIQAWNGRITAVQGSPQKTENKAR